MKWRPRHWIAQAARQWGWRDFGLGLFIGSATLFNMGGAMFFPSDFLWSRAWTYNVIQFGLPYVFAMHVTNLAVDDGASAWLAYACAVLAVVVSGVWLIGPMLSPIIGGDSGWSSAMDVMLAVNVLLPLSIATFAYAQWRFGVVMRRQLVDGELERARRQQVIQAQRLLAMQARVEPQLLFDSLKSIHAQVDNGENPNDPLSAKAETQLADLIALLRIMQPHANATASSVGREFDLLRAFAKVSNHLALAAIAENARATPQAQSAAFAPLVLLPLLRNLAQTSPEMGWQVSAACANERLVVTITPGDPSNASPQRWQRSREALGHTIWGTLQSRLINVHGPSATAIMADDAIVLSHPLKPLNLLPAVDRSLLSIST